MQGVIGEAYAAGKITGNPEMPRLPTSLKSQYKMLQKYGMPYTGVVTHLALSTWSMIHGMTSLCLYGYLSGFLGGQVESFLETEIEKTIRIIGIV